MKRTNRIIMLAGACALLLQAPLLANYSDTFDGRNIARTLSYGLDAPGVFSDGELVPTVWTGQKSGGYMSNLGAYSASPLVYPHDWVTNDSMQLDGLLPYWDPAFPTDRWALLGGAASDYTNTGGPSVPVTELWTPLSEGVDSRFTVDFGVLAGNSMLNNDSFGWTVRAVNGDALFRVIFRPSATVETNGALDVYVQDGAEVDSNATGTDTHWTVFQGGKYNFDLTTHLSAVPGESNYSFVITGSNVQPFSGQISNVNNNLNVGEIAATWVLSGSTDVNGFNYGENYMLFNNYAVTVPEPSTVALVLGGLGFMAMLGRRRRAS